MKIKKKIRYCIIILLSCVILGIAIYTQIPITSKIPKKITEEYQVVETTFQNRKIFEIAPKEGAKKEKVIFYLHGGSFMGKLEQYHWKFCKDLIEETGFRMIVPDYPLAPKYNYQEVFSMLEPVYEQVAEKYGAENIILLGDSSGGGVALALEQLLGKKDKEVPSKLILISPWLDSKLENPERKQIKDPILKEWKLRIASFAYRGKDNYLANPIKGPMDKLKNVIIYTGTKDMLNPDVHLLKEKANKYGDNIEIRETKEAVHIWILRDKEKIYRAKEDFQNLVEELKK